MNHISHSFLSFTPRLSVALRRIALPCKLWFAVCTLFLCAQVATAQTVTADAPPTGDNICLLSSLDLSTVTYYNDQGKNSVQADKATFGTGLIVRDTLYTTGVGTHAPSKFIAKVNGATRFSAILGIDDAAAVNSDGSAKTNEGIVDYTITTYKSAEDIDTVATGTIKRTDSQGFHLDVDLTGATYLVLDFAIGTNNWSDHVDVCNAYFEYTGNAPVLTSSEPYCIEIPTAEEGVENIPLSSLEISKSTCGWGTVQANKSIGNNSIKLGGYTYASGVGTHGPSKIIVKLNGSVTRFYGIVGLDDEIRANASKANQANADYKAYLKGQDGTESIQAQGTITGKDTTYPEIDIDVNGWKYLVLETTNGSDGTNGNDHVDWANAYLVFQDQNSTRPEIVSEEEISSNLDCATTVYSQPGVRFMHKVRSTNSEATVAVKNLPDGLSWNADRQLVEGIVNTPGTYTYQADVTADGTTTTTDITFVVSDELQLPLPFMGWLSWNSVQSEVSEEIVKKVADLFVEKGLYDCGWNTIMMDDWWHADSRASDGTPQPNATRFPNGVKTVADYVHDKGMKFGLYTDAAAKTCAGAFGSYGSETTDANTYASWGIDIVKCDYCNAPSDVESAKTRYKALADAFKASDRDITLYICEWGVREPWKWGAEVGGACWRISQDVRDCWEGTGSGVGVVQSINAMKGLANWQGVNRWNDADMLCTGLHATGKSSNDLCKVKGMTQDEYRTQFALWCMWSSPMALSFDPRSTSITDDDYAIMTNTDLIALNQDRMGQQADLVSETDDMVIFAKDCENGDIALSFTNLSSASQDVTLDFNSLPHLSADSTYTCRDLWAKENLDDVKGKLTTTVNSHATRVFRLALKGKATSLGEVLAQKGTIRIYPATDGESIVVKTNGMQGMPKRILVSDMQGRVVRTITSAQETISVNVPAGLYVVNVVCNAQATSAKVEICANGRSHVSDRAKENLAVNHLAVR